MSAEKGTVAPVGKKPRSEPKKLGTLTDEEAFWHPIILASFAVLLLLAGLARWTSVLVSAIVLSALILIGLGCAGLATLTAASRKAQALNGLRAAITSKDQERIRVAICRAAVTGVTVPEALAVKEVRSSLDGAGAKLNCASKAASARDLRQKVGPHECEQCSVSCEMHARTNRFGESALAPRECEQRSVSCEMHTRPNRVGESAVAAAVAGSLAVPASAAPEVPILVAPSVQHAPLRATQRAGRKRTQDVWFDGDVAPWILL